jgi:hypothetical protein
MSLDDKPDRPKMSFDGGLLCEANPSIPYRALRPGRKLSSNSILLSDSQISAKQALFGFYAKITGEPLN